MCKINFLKRYKKICHKKFDANEIFISISKTNKNTFSNRPQLTIFEFNKKKSKNYKYYN